MEIIIAGGKMKEDIEKIAEEIEKFKKGDEQAFEEIYKLSKETIEGYIVSFFKDKNYQEDILQETYLQIYKNINQLKEPKAFLGWAKKITVNILKRYKDKCKSENDKIELSKKRDFDIEYEKTNTELIVENKNKQEIVREALNSLTDIKKIIVTDYYFNNMKVDEIAESLEIASGIVKNHLFQARKTLDKKLRIFKESLDVLLLSWFTKEIENFAINKESENNNFTMVIKNLAQNESLKEPINIDSEQYGLNKKSTILAEQIRTIDKRRIKERLGKLNEEDIKKIDKAILISFGIK